MKSLVVAVLFAAVSFSLNPRASSVTVDVPVDTGEDGTAVPAMTGSRIGQAEAQAALDFHNAKRAEVKSPALTWSSELATVAQTWANHLATEGSCSLAHTANNPYGENLFGGSGVEYTAKSAAESWYEEIKDYRYGALTPANWYKTGHYTQMVWSATRRMGMGRASCKDGVVIIAAEYDPPGNFMGEKPY